MTNLTEKGPGVFELEVDEGDEVIVSLRRYMGPTGEWSEEIGKITKRGALSKKCKPPEPRRVTEGYDPDDIKRR